LLSSSAVAAQAPLSVNDLRQTSEVRFDASRLRTGRFDYWIMQSGKQIATFAITIDKRSDGSFRSAAKGSNQDIALSRG
jgi:hypothetical protein